MDLYTTKRVLDTIREKFPLYNWYYDRRSRVWKCEVGYVARVWMMNEHEREYTRLCFYPKLGVPVWV